MWIFDFYFQSSFSNANRVRSEQSTNDHTITWYGCAKKKIRDVATEISLARRWRSSKKCTIEEIINTSKQASSCNDKFLIRLIVVILDRNRDEES